MYFKRASYRGQSPDYEIGIKELINLLDFTPIKPPEQIHFRTLTPKKKCERKVFSLTSLCTASES